MPRRKKSRAKKPAQVDRPTGRFTADEKAAILDQLDAGRTKTELARQYGTTTVTIQRWVKARRAARTLGSAASDAGLQAPSTRPLTSPGALGAAETELVLDTKREHP